MDFFIVLVLGMAFGFFLGRVTKKDSKPNQSAAVPVSGGSGGGHQTQEK